MAQTTSALTAIDAKLEYSPDGVTWHDISGNTNKVTPGGGERTAKQTHTLGTEDGILSAGRRSMKTLDVVILYTEVDAEAFIALYQNFFALNTPVYFRYSPKGGQSGEYQFAGGPGYITKMPEPEADAESENLLTSTFTWSGPQFTLAKAS